MVDLVQISITPHLKIDYENVTYMDTRALSRSGTVFVKEHFIICSNIFISQTSGGKDTFIFEIGLVKYLLLIKIKLK